MNQEEDLACVVCGELVDNPMDEICATCADDIRVEEGCPYDDFEVDPITGQIYAAWGVDLHPLKALSENLNPEEKPFNVPPQ